MLTVTVRALYLSASSGSGYVLGVFPKVKVLILKVTSHPRPCGIYPKSPNAFNPFQDPFSSSNLKTLPSPKEQYFQLAKEEVPAATPVTQAPRPAVEVFEGLGFRLQRLHAQQCVCQY